MAKKVEEKKKEVTSTPKSTKSTKTKKDTVKKIVKEEVKPVVEKKVEKVKPVVESKDEELLLDNKTNGKGILIFVGIICLALGVLGGILFGKQLSKKDKKTEKEVVTQIEEKIEKVYSCEFNSDDAIVSLNEDNMVSNLELYQTLKDDYGIQSLINIIDKKILEKKYPDELNNAKNEAKATIKQLEDAYKDELQQAIQYYTGYQTVDAYQDYLYVAYLQNLAVEEYVKKQFDENDIKKYYDEEIVGDIKLRHILITPETSSDMTDAEIKAAQDEAKEKIEAIISELKNTNAKDIENKFIELAKEQSDDKTTKNNGGSLGFVNKGTLSEYYENVINEAYKLKDGEYSTKVIETTLGYHVVLRTESKEKDTLENVKDTIIETLVTEYMNNNGEAIVNYMDNVRKEAGMKFNDKNLETKYNTYINNLIKSYKQN